DVVGVAGELVREDDRLDLDAVHQDHTRPRVGIDGELVERLDVELGPVPELILDRDAGVLQRVHARPPCSATACASSSFVIAERPSMPISCAISYSSDFVRSSNDAEPTRIIRSADPPAWAMIIAALVSRAQLWWSTSWARTS